MEKSNLRAVIYVRVSGHNAHSIVSSINRQMNLCSARANKDGNQVIRIVSDCASGLDEKNEGKRIVEKLTEGESFDVLYITGMDRISRSRSVYLNFQKLLKEHHIKIKIAGSTRHPVSISKVILKGMRELARKHK